MADWIASSRSEGTDDLEQIKQGNYYTGEVKIWDAATGKLLLTFGHRAALTDLEFSPDGKQLAAATNDYAVIIWDVSELSDRRPAK
jgi:WD40 repeat protein